MSIPKNIFAATMMVALAAVVQAPARALPSEWCAENVVVPDGPEAGEFLNLELTPYLKEPLDFSSFDAPCNEIAIRKSAQTGFSLWLQSAAAYMIVHDPCDSMIMQPTQTAMKSFNRKKFARIIDKTPALNKRILKEISRDANSSTANSKLFPGGSLELVIASSTAELRGQTIKWSGNDEVDEYEQDLNDQGGPLEMAEARQESFLMSGEWKRFYISTPTIKHESEIDHRFYAGDQRFWHMPCPGCSEKFIFEFNLAHFKFKETYPHEAHYVTPCCGHIIEGHEKVEVMRRGEWIPTASRPGAYPSYHLDGLTSPFVPWDKIAERFIKAKDSPSKLKAFYNLTLGLSYEMTGDAPDHVRLMERRIVDLKRGVIPPKGLVLVCGADVQGNGIYYTIRAFASDGQNWPVDADFIAGDTDKPDAGAFLKLSELAHKEWPDCYGGKRRIDMMAVDSGYRSHVVYTFARNHVALGVVPINGVDGWGKPAFGVGTKVEINFNNERIRSGAVRYPIGTWPLKGLFFTALNAKGIASGKDADPSNYIHFAGWQDEAYFKQITGEFLAEEKYRGRTRRIWKEVPGKENHFLDTEIYLRALFHHMTDRFTIDDWQLLSSERNVPAEVTNPDLFAPKPHQINAQNKSEAAPDPVQVADTSNDESFWD